MDAAVQSSREVLIALKQQNGELRKKLAHKTSHDSRANSADVDIAATERKVLALKARYDKQVVAHSAQVAKLEHELGTLRRLQREGAHLLDDAATTRSVRLAEDRMEKASLLHHEALNAQRAYDRLVRQLQADLLAATQQLRGVEERLAEQESKVKELRAASTEAVQSRASAGAQLARARSHIAKQRAAQRAALESRKAAIDAMLKSNRIMLQEVCSSHAKLRQLCRGWDEDEVYFLSRHGSIPASVSTALRNDGAGSSAPSAAASSSEGVAAESSSGQGRGEPMTVQVAWRMVQNATDVASPAHLVRQAVMQREVLESLKAMKEDGQALVGRLKAELTEAQTRLEPLRLAACSSSTRVDDVAAKLQQEVKAAREQVQLARDRAEESAKEMASMLSGLERLQNMAMRLPSARPHRAVTEDTCLDVLASIHASIAGALTGVHGKAPPAAPGMCASNLRLDVEDNARAAPCGSQRERAVQQATVPRGQPSLVDSSSAASSESDDDEHAALRARLKNGTRSAVGR